ncbi:MAG: serine/threonine protein kinase, partial [Planctomycetota bacterium]
MSAASDLPRRPHLGAFPLEDTKDARPQDPSATDAPRSLGGVELLRPLGRGGMGTLFVGRDPRLDRTVAVKLLSAGERASPQQKARFRREGESLAKLRHPNVVRVHEVGNQGPWDYLVLEYLPGPSLATLLEREGPLPVERALDLGLSLARGLAAVHAAGVLHRDLKPANVVLRGNEPVLVDFGLARLEDASRALTHSHQVLGTPAYMPPEQAGGGAVGPASDVYGLGALLYALLTGAPPHASCTNLPELFAAMLRGPPPPPSSLRPEVPRALDEALLRCLEPEPGARYGSMEELAADLERLLAGNRVAGRTLRPRSLVRRLRGPRTFLLALPLGGVLCLFAAAQLTLTPRALSRGESQAKASATSAPPVASKTGGRPPPVPAAARSARQQRRAARLLRRAEEENGAGRFEEAALALEAFAALGSTERPPAPLCDALWAATGIARGRGDLARAHELTDLGVQLFSQVPGAERALANLLRDRGWDLALRPETAVRGFSDLRRALALAPAAMVAFFEQPVEEAGGRVWYRRNAVRGALRRWDREGRGEA